MLGFRNITSYPNRLRNKRISGGSAPKNFVSFLTRFGLVKFGGSGSFVTVAFKLFRKNDCERAWTLFSLNTKQILRIIEKKNQKKNLKKSYLNAAKSSRSLSNSCVTKCCERISDDKCATLRANVTTCDSSLWKRLFIPWQQKKMKREIGKC